MNITVNVDEVSLDTVVAEILEYDNEDGETRPVGERTIGDIVAEKLLERLVNSDRGSGYQGLLTQVREARRGVPVTTPVPGEIRKAAHDATTLPLGQALRTSPYELVDLALDTAAPLIRASEREHVAAALRRAMGDNDSLHLCRHMLDGHSCGGRTLAQLLGEDGHQ